MDKVCGIRYTELPSRDSCPLLDTLCLSAKYPFSLSGSCEITDYFVIHFHTDPICLCPISITCTLASQPVVQKRLTGRANRLPGITSNGEVSVG